MESKNSYSSVVSSSSYSYNKNNQTNYLNFTNKSSNNFCNNCGKYGHMSYQCNTPITSIGIIAFRNCPISEINPTPKREYLLIRRKDTLGYIDFIRGKYSVYNKPYILNMFKQMTKEERQRILKYAKEENTQDYGFKLWRQLWTNETISITPYFHTSSQKSETKYFKPTEEKISKEKFTILSNGRGMGKGRHPFHLQTLIDECQQFPSWSWEEPEWGFPKGRRDTEETDWVCALREFKEETGQPSDTAHDSSFSKIITTATPPPPPPPGLIRIPSKYNLRPQSALMNIHSTSGTTSVSIENKIQPITNLYPFEENFLGSNYKPYKHKYYLMKMDYHDSDITFLSTEVSKVAWKSYEECMELIRFYNIEKKQMLTKIHLLLDNFMLI
jgi:8-oxo-dGTP pyrophosphatase MutT (NUDIX family)